MWKKVGAALGSAVMIGATLAGAALADTKDLGDYKDLMIGADGAVTGLFVVGANAAAADVVGAIGMSAFVGQNAMTSGAGTGDITLTQIGADVAGVKRHVELDNDTSNAYEFGSAGASSDVIGPTGYASGDGVVDYLYSYKDKGPIYYLGDEYNWHEDVKIVTASIDALRDNKDTNAGDKYDEVFLEVASSAVEYRLAFDTTVNETILKGQKIWFMGKEYTVISSNYGDNLKLGASEAEVVLTTADPAVTIGGVDATLGGIFSTGTGSTYKAKVTVTNGGTTETKYVTAGTTDTIAGIEVYVKNAVVTTTGTNEGEAQMVIGAGILKLTDGDYLKLGDGTETTWQVKHGGAGDNFTSLNVTDLETHSTVSATNTVLYPGDSVTSPNGLFGLTFNGLTDKYGNAPEYVDVDIMPTTRNLGSGSNVPVIRIRTPGGDYINYLDNGGTSKIASEIWVNATEGDTKFWYRDVSASTLTYRAATVTTLPNIQLTTSNRAYMDYDFHKAVGANATENVTGKFFMYEPALSQDSSSENITIEYNSSGNSAVGLFEDINNDGGEYYAYYADYGAEAATTFIADATSGATPSTRDYYTKWGTYADSAGSTLLSLQMPMEQSFGEIVFGTQATSEGTPQTVAAGETVTIGGTTLKVEGAVAGSTAVALPAAIAKTDAEVTAADKSGYNLVLVGGPVVNTLVNALQTEGKLEKTIGAAGSTADIATAGAGVVELVADAFATGKYAVVVAGSDRAGTKAAANILANFDDYAAKLDGLTVYEV